MFQSPPTRFTCLKGSLPVRIFAGKKTLKNRSSRARCFFASLANSSRGTFLSLRTVTGNNYLTIAGWFSLIDYLYLYEKRRKLRLNWRVIPYRKWAFSDLRRLTKNRGIGIGSSPIGNEASAHPSAGQLQHIWYNVNPVLITPGLFYWEGNI